MSPRLLAGIPLLLTAWFGGVAEADQVFQSPQVSEISIVFQASSLNSFELPPQISALGMPTVFRTRLTLACLTIPANGETLLVYTPSTGGCKRLGIGFHGLPGERKRIEAKLAEGPYAVVMAQARPDAVAGHCGCPNNQPPVVNVTSGVVQTVAPGAPITAIVFAATDPDSEVLLEDFSYTLDGGGSVPGLPAPLVENCMADTGTLDCTVTGNAPAGEGQYLIRMEVSDGLESASATATLIVSADGIFIHGFEGGI